MMKRILVVMIIAASPLFAQEAKKKTEAEAMMDFYIEAAKPVGEHARIAELAGPWHVTTRLWFAPDAAPMVATGKGQGKLILGGRFLALETDLKGDFPGEALTVMGFDRRTSEFTMVGFDTLGTYSITAAGKDDPAQKAVVLRGTYAQPPSGQEQKYHFVWTRPSKNEQLLTLYFDMGGQDVRVAETRLVRE
jgi:hypothetical protein